MFLCWVVGAYDVMEVKKIFSINEIALEDIKVFKSVFLDISFIDGKTFHNCLQDFQEQLIKVKICTIIIHADHAYHVIFYFNCHRFGNQDPFISGNGNNFCWNICALTWEMQIFKLLFVQFFRKSSGIYLMHFNTNFQKA